MSSESFSSKISSFFSSRPTGQAAIKPDPNNPFWYDDIEPTRLWDEHLSKVTKWKKVTPHVLPANGSADGLPKKPEGHLRFMAISDTHNYHAHLPVPAPEVGVDVLVHAGDFSNIGSSEDVAKFTKWLRESPIKHRVLIAGNHDLSFDTAEYQSGLAKRFGHPTPYVDSERVKRTLTDGYDQQKSTAEHPFPAFKGGLAYLEDAGISIEGVRIWGSPWQPAFYDWAFNLPRGAPLREKWARIPNLTDVLVTHGPPLGHGDKCKSGLRAGCADLLMDIQQRIKPRYHVFGHIHEDYGQSSDGTTDFINASNCNYNYDPSKLHPPIIFDVPIPK